MFALLLTVTRLSTAYRGSEDHQILPCVWQPILFESIILYLRQQPLFGGSKYRLGADQYRKRSNFISKRPLARPLRSLMACRSLALALTANGRHFVWKSIRTSPVGNYLFLPLAMTTEIDRRRRDRDIPLRLDISDRRRSASIAKAGGSPGPACSRPISPSSPICRETEGLWGLDDSMCKQPFPSAPPCVPGSFWMAERL